jgi:hypothetical protein
MNDEIRAAKVALRKDFGEATWLRGMGIGKEGGKLVIRVNVASLTAKVRERIPLQYKGFDVHVTEVGNIFA